MEKVPTSEARSTHSGVSLGQVVLGPKCPWVELSGGKEGNTAGIKVLEKIVVMVVTTGQEP